MTVQSGGVLRLTQEDQIPDSANVTINGTGEFQMDRKDETIGSLTMNGGLVQGNDRLGLLDVILESISLGFDFYSELVVLGQFNATSFSTTLSAKLQKIGYTVSNSTVTVADGPAFNDLILIGVASPDAMTKTGAGVLLDRTESSSVDSITVAQGLLRFENKQEGTNVIVNAGGRFSGDSTIASLTVNSGGRVRPGPLSGTGVMKIEGDLVLNSGAILEATLNGAVGGSGHDQLDVNGTVSVDGALLELTLGPNANIGQQYRIINNNLNDAVIGKFFVTPSTAPFHIASPTGQRLSIDHAGGTFGNDVVLTLENTPPMAPNLSLDRNILDEGDYVTASGTLVDPDLGDSLRLIVDWGDGSKKQTFRPGVKHFAIKHQYLDDGVFAARFEWLDQRGTGNSRQFNVTVNNVAPLVTVEQDRNAATDRFFALGTVSDPGQDQLSAWVDYGDGSGLKRLQIEDGRFVLSHRYKQPGRFTLKVTVRDDDGAETVVTRIIVV